MATFLGPVRRTERLPMDFLSERHSTLDDAACRPTVHNVQCAMSWRQTLPDAAQPGEPSIPAIAGGPLAAPPASRPASEDSRQGDSDQAPSACPRYNRFRA